MNQVLTLDDIQPYVDEALSNGEWVKVNDALGKGGKIIGEIYGAEYTGVWVRGFMGSDGKMIVNNAGVIK